MGLDPVLPGLQREGIEAGPNAFRGERDHAAQREDRVAEGLAIARDRQRFPSGHLRFQIADRLDEKYFIVRQLAVGPFGLAGRFRIVCESRDGIPFVFRETEALGGIEEELRHLKRGEAF